MEKYGAITCSKCSIEMKKKGKRFVCPKCNRAITLDHAKALKERREDEDE